MTRLATLEEYFRARGEEPPQNQEHEAVMRAKQALAFASKFVQTSTGRRFDRVEAVITLDGTGSASLVLPNPPIAEVISVTTLDSQGEETEVEETDYRLDASAGILRRIDGLCWPRGYLNVQVELLSGYLLPEDEEESGEELTALPADLIGAVISIASRVFDANTTGGGSTAGAVTSVTMGVYSETYSDASSTALSEVGMTAEEVAVLERYRRVGVA